MNTTPKRNRHNAVPFEDIVQFVLSSPHSLTVQALAAACKVGTDRASKAIKEARKRRPDAPAIAGSNQYTAMPFEEIVQFVLNYDGKITVNKIASECRIGNHRAMKAINAARDVNPDLNTGPRVKRREKRTMPVATPVQQAAAEIAAMLAEIAAMLSGEKSGSAPPQQRRNQHTAMPHDAIVQYVLDNGGCMTVRAVAKACNVCERRSGRAIREAKRWIAGRTPVLSMQPARPRRRELHYVVGDTAYRCSRYRPDWPPGGHFAVMEIGSQPGVLPVAESA